MKMTPRSALCFSDVQLPEAGLIQATVALEDLPLLPDNRPGGDSGEFVVSIWLVKNSMRDIKTAQTIQAVEKPTFIGDADDHKVRMRRIGWKKRFADFNYGVARLNNLLRKGQVSPDKDV
jgi:hypothetical protein